MSLLWDLLRHETLGVMIDTAALRKTAQRVKSRVCFAALLRCFSSVSSFIDEDLDGRRKTVSRIAEGSFLHARSAIPIRADREHFSRTSFADCWLGDCRLDIPTNRNAPIRDFDLLNQKRLS